MLAVRVNGMPQEDVQRYNEEKAHGGLRLCLCWRLLTAIVITKYLPALNVGTDEIIPWYFSVLAKRNARARCGLMCQLPILDGRVATLCGGSVATLGHRP